jgi:hypothetical protein
MFNWLKKLFGFTKQEPIVIHRERYTIQPIIMLPVPVTHRYVQPMTYEDPKEKLRSTASRLLGTTYRLLDEL